MPLKLTNSPLVYHSPAISVEPPSYFIAFDGGGTKCRGRLVDSSRRILAEVTGGMGNVNLNCGEVIERMIHLSYEALAQAGLPKDTVASLKMGAGLAGFEISTVSAQMKAYRKWPFHSYSLTHDSIIACLGAHAGNEGGIIIIGTGFCGNLMLERETVKIGGWGHVVSDVGGGSWLGREALTIALKAEEGLHPRSALSKALMENFEHSPEKLCLWAKEASSKDFGQFAPLVFDYADQGDPVALPLVRQTKLELENMLRVLLERRPPRLSLIGGLAERAVALLDEDLAECLSPPLGTPIDGALYFAMNSD